jgi:stress-induced-phosphoprotein 1
MQNPEVQNILGDPAMQMILQQMQRDPAAIQDHLKNPAVAEKFQKLMDAGIIQMR